MNEPQKAKPWSNLHVYIMLCRALRAQPRESLHRAATRYLRRGVVPLKREVAEIVLNHEARGEDVWAALHRAAALLVDE